MIDANKQDNEVRKMSDILLSLEEQVKLLVKTISANDLNNKLILDRLNKLVATPLPSVVVAPPPPPSATKEPVVYSISPSMSDVNKAVLVPRKSPEPKPTPVKKTDVAKPIVTSRSVVAGPAQNTRPVAKATKSSNGEQGKIPVSQRVIDQNGKDIFLVDIVITDTATGEIAAKSKTSAAGKWYAYLGDGTYTVHMSKVINPETEHKIESRQQIEVNTEQKALQLPTATINRSPDAI